MNIETKMKQIKVIRSLPKIEDKKKRVAAYARVSTYSERLEHSLLAQIDYFHSYILSRSEWEYVGVYYDDSKSGTNTEGRKYYQKMIEDAKQGKIDIILTKSISRFARNTVDLLNTIRELKTLGVAVIFEREKINTLTLDGEFLLSLLASFAEEESRSTSLNLKWAVKKRYEEGEGIRNRVYGYRWDGKELVVEKIEAEVIKEIYSEYLKEKSPLKIAESLNKRGITHFGRPFNDMALYYILTNERYTGDLVLQKYYVSSFPELKLKKNNGEKDRYYVENHHRAIIDRKTQEKVLKEMERRRAVDVHTRLSLPSYPFSGKLYCSVCSSPYRRYIKTPYPNIWRCKNSKEHHGKGIRERDLENLSSIALNTHFFEEERMEKVGRIEGDGKGNFTFIFQSGEKRSVNITQIKEKKNGKS